MTEENALAPSMEEIASFGKKLVESGEPLELESDVASTLNELNDLESDVDIESTWADEPGENAVEADAPSGQPEDEHTAPEEGTDPTQTIKFKVNGKEQELTLEEAKKQLSMSQASKAWTGEKAKLTKALKSERAKLDKLKTKAESFDKLDEAYRKNPQEIFKLVTGEDFKTYLDREVAKRELYRSGTEEEKRIMDQEAKISEMERRMEMEKLESENRVREAEELEFEADKTRMQNLMTEEFRKYQLPEDIEPTVANRLKRMLWAQSTADLKAYYAKYGRLTPKMYEKAFSSNAAALNYFKENVVEKEVGKAVKAKKEDAKNKAQIASARNYGKKEISEELIKKDPLSLFNIMRRGK